MGHFHFIKHAIFWKRGFNSGVSKGSVDISEKLDSHGLEILYGPVNFRERGLGIVHGHGSDKPGEPVRILGHAFSHAIVRRLGQLRRNLQEIFY